MGFLSSIEQRRMSFRRAGFIGKDERTRYIINFQPKNPFRNLGAFWWAHNFFIPLHQRKVHSPKPQLLMLPLCGEQGISIFFLSTSAVHQKPFSISPYKRIFGDAPWALDGYKKKQKTKRKIHKIACGEKVAHTHVTHMENRSDMHTDVIRTRESSGDQFLFQRLLFRRE